VIRLALGRSDAYAGGCGGTHENAFALPAFDQVQGFKDKHGAPNGSGADAQFILEPGDGWKPLADLEFAGLNPALTRLTTSSC
jgi:hypothetical protein